MYALIIIVALLQSIAVALGVGNSTSAITQFFVALSDGTIDATERKMMQITYVLLRIAMGIIFITTGILTIIQYGIYGASYFTPFVIGFWLLIFILFINAFLMTIHIMPATFGPALQAASWYTMGILMALFSLGLYEFSFVQFSIGYGSMIVFATCLVNGTLWVLKHKNKA